MRLLPTASGYVFWRAGRIFFYSWNPGMNSDHTPESLWLVIVLLGVLMLIGFKRKEWLMGPKKSPR